MQILFIAVECRLILVDELCRLFVFVIYLTEQREEDRQTDDLENALITMSTPLGTHLDRLNQNHGRDETAQQCGQPLLDLAVTELDAANDDEEERYHCNERRQAISDEHAPPRKHPQSFQLALTCW